MTIWIFTLSEYNDYNPGPWEDIITLLIEQKKWKIGHRTIRRKYLKEDDKVIFYVSGKNNKFFIADAVLTSKFIFEKDPNYVFTPGYVEINDINRFEEPIYIKPLLNKLKFIKNKKHWGLYFQGGVYPIESEDYDTIISSMKL